MKILWLSHSGSRPTGYGNQTSIFPKIMKEHGHDVIILPILGTDGYGRIDENGIIELPLLNHTYGADIVSTHYKMWERDAIISFSDPFSFITPPEIYGQMNWIASTPIDSVPINQDIANTISVAKRIWAWSHFGEKQLKEEGFFNVDYVPCGILTDLYKSSKIRTDDKMLFGKEIGIDLSNKFLVTINAANLGSPSRKCFYENLGAFKLFSDAHEDAILYIHTERDGKTKNGEYLPAVMDLIGLDASKVFFPMQYHYLMGMYGPDYLRIVYSASDVLLHGTRAEGFGLAMIEAQACGTPVIGTDFSSMPELNPHGWNVQGYSFMSSPGVLQCIPHIDQLFLALEKAYDNRDNTELRTKCREFALQFDANIVYDKYMAPALEKLNKRKNPAEDVARMMK